MSPFIVCWTEYTPWKWAAEKMTDHWETFDHLVAAEKLFRQLLDDPAVYTASICRPVKSTDYQTVKEGCLS